MFEGIIRNSVSGMLTLRFPLDGHVKRSKRELHTSLGRGPSWKCPQDIVEILNRRIFITWTLGCSNQESLHSILNSDCFKKIFYKQPI